MEASKCNVCKSEIWEGEEREIAGAVLRGPVCDFCGWRFDQSFSDINQKCPGDSLDFLADKIILAACEVLNLSLLIARADAIADKTRATLRKNLEKKRGFSTNLESHKYD